MPNGTSVIGTAKEMTLSVAAGLTRTYGAMQEYLRHLENRKAHLEALLLDPKAKSDVKAMLAEVIKAIDALKKAMVQVQDGADRAVKIESRL